MRVAAVQMVSGQKIENNLAAAADLIAEAAKQGAQLAVLPENFALFGQGNLATRAQQESAGAGELLPFLAEQASAHNIWLIGGTIPLAKGVDGRMADGNKAFASSCLFNAEGKLIGRYDKIHLFDAGVNDAVGAYRESAQFCAGTQAICMETPWARLGLSVCYDLRFPEYFRQLSELGAQMFAVPSAFVYITGKAHWEVLLRARAIENQCFVVAANQGGLHGANRQTWGQSAIINPWGEIMAQLQEGEGVVVADCNFEEQSALREKMPVLQHRRF